MTRSSTPSSSSSSSFSSSANISVNYFGSSPSNKNGSNLMLNQSSVSSDNSNTTNTTYKDFGYYLSSCMSHIEVSVFISSIELVPSSSITKNNDALNLHEELYVTVQIFNSLTTLDSDANRIALHTIPISTKQVCRINRNGTTLSWNEWITLPVKYKELARNSQLQLTIWGVGDAVVGTCQIPFFNEKGVLIDGQHRMPIISKEKGVEEEEEEEERASRQQVEWGDDEHDLYRLEMRRQKYDRREMPRNDWLDRVTNRRIARIRRGQEVYGAFDKIPTFATFPDTASLWIELPFFGHPVLYEEEIYPHSNNHYHPTSSSEGPQLISIFDPELNEENPVELKYRKLARDILRGAIDPNLKPSRMEKNQLEQLFANPNDQLKNEEKDLIWKFRYVLRENKRAITKFLLSVDWHDEEEVKVATELLDQWVEVDIADALKLLGRQKEFQQDVVREFAVRMLDTARDEELLDYLLQLVQALRYEKYKKKKRRAGSNNNANQDDEDAHDSSDGNVIGPLARFLVERACQNELLANYLYWYVKVEAEFMNEGAELFAAVYEYLESEMKVKSASCYEMLSLQNACMSNVTKCQVRAREEKGKKDQKEEKLRVLLKNMNWPKNQIIRMPLDPSILLTGLNASSAKMFKSAMYPAVIEFYTNSKQSSNKPQLYKVMFKNGDDLRQDQLVMQMFLLMDRLLKRVNLDLKLTPYRILATGPCDGLMEFVLDSCPVSHVVASYESPQILSFLKKHQPDPDAPYGIHPEALSTYVKSVAGSCVLTYLLGIGDRHLDNLMMKTQGHLFHIDFGCIFGRDPKPYPPPFKLTKEMVLGMGGPQSPHYKKFKTYCCQAYNWLRKSAPLILNLLHLMVDAGIEELSQDPTTTLAKVQEKFRLDLTDEQAEQFFLSLINDSVTALFPVIMDVIHKVATKLR